MKIAASNVILTNMATDAIYVDVLFSVYLYRKSLVSHVSITYQGPAGYCTSNICENLSHFGLSKLLCAKYSFTLVLRK